MAELIDFNGDGEINWKDCVVLGVTLVGNVICMVANILY